MMNPLSCLALGRRSSPTATLTLIRSKTRPTASLASYNFPPPPVYFNRGIWLRNEGVVCLFCPGLYPDATGTLCLRVEVVDMGNLLRDLLAVAGTQILGRQVSKSSPRKTVLAYTKNCIRRMKDFDLTPEDVADVFWKGKRLKENMIARSFNGYEIGLYYFGVPDAGLYVVTTVWKNSRK
jgi:hypothetical protein